jgi:hypothetical protein
VLDPVLDHALAGDAGEDHRWLREIATLDATFAWPPVLTST